MDPNYLTAQPVELGGIPRPRVLLKDVYGLYADQFRRWFFITAPTSLLASVVLFIADQRIRAIYARIPRGEIQFHWLEIGEASVLRYCGFFISWILGCFALAAIATVVNGLDVSDINDVWVRDSYQRAREHSGPLLLAACYTFGLFLAGMAVAISVEVALSLKVTAANRLRFAYYAGLIGYLVVGSVVSWFGMAIPLIVSDDVGAWRALKRSVRLSNGYEGFLFLLVIESLACSYVAWYTVHFGLSFLFPVQLRYTAWYGWLVYSVSILASAAVQPPTFIGFSLLARNNAR
ncbi:MAG: hypothetical protein ABSF72_16120 [Candidatus Sulfotelmatobacter sp.]